MGKLNVQEVRAGDVVILNLTGSITIGEGSVALRSVLRRLLEERKNRILLNLANISYIDSSGLGELVGGFSRIRREGGELKLLNLTQRIRDLLAITKLLTVFDVYEDEHSALGSF